MRARGTEAGQKEKSARRSEREREEKKGEEKRDDVLPKPRATYGALAARLLITRPSLFPPSLSRFFFRFHRPTVKVSSPDSLR